MQFINGVFILQLIELLLLSLFCIPNGHSEWFVIDLFKININCFPLVHFVLSRKIIFAPRFFFRYHSALTSDQRQDCRVHPITFFVINFPTFFTLHLACSIQCTIKYSLWCPKYITPAFSLSICAMFYWEIILLQFQFLENFQ